MKSILFAAALLLACALPVFAADSGQSQTAPAFNFDQKQAEILSGIDARSAALQDERSCVQAAKNLDDLKACRDKQMAAMEKRRSDMMGRGAGGGQMPSQSQ